MNTMPHIVAVATLVLLVLTGGTAGVRSPGPEDAIPTVFTIAETKACQMIRIPQAVRTESSIIVWGQCRHRSSDGLKVAPKSLGDDELNTTIIQKRSTDGGKTWSGTKVLTGAGYGNVGAIYDASRKKIVLQYQHITHDQPSNRYTSYLQMESTDDGNTWSAPRDISEFLAPCNTEGASSSQTMQSAGNKIVTSSGRYLFAGWGGVDDRVCVWSSVDGGSTYSASLISQGREVSFVEVSPGVVALNGRGHPYSWFPLRTQWISHDDGLTWGAATSFPLQDPGKNGCEASIANVPSLPNTFLFSNPTERARHGMELRISHSGLSGSWSTVSKLPYSGPMPAGYSAIVVVDSNTALVVYETGETSYSPCTFTFQLVNF